MPKKIKLNRSIFKSNQAFVQIKKCIVSGHEVGDVFTRTEDKKGDVISEKHLDCNKWRYKLHGRKEQQAPFTLGMSNKPQEGWKVL